MDTPDERRLERDRWLAVAILLNGCESDEMAAELWQRLGLPPVILDRGGQADEGTEPGQ